MQLFEVIIWCPVNSHSFEKVLPRFKWKLYFCQIGGDEESQSWDGIDAKSWSINPYKFLSGHFASF